MAFLFKSKKNQDRALNSRDGPPGAPLRAAREDKGSHQRSTPTSGSLNSIDNDGSTGSPDHTQIYGGRQRAQTAEQPSQPSPPQQQQPPPQQPLPQPLGQSQPSDLPFRNPPSMAPNPNASLYPWTQRRLTYTSSHPSPFPRYGAAVNSVSSKEGDIYVMGGLINSSTVKGDLWLIEAGGSMACYPLATSAEGPGPRVGHASLLVGNAFIVYGGDTKIDDADVLDETLYLLNTSTRHWSRALPAGPRPSGRYGHSLNILGSKIYIFGGQVEGHFMNDLSAFDLNQLQMPNNRWEMLILNSDSGAAPQAKIPPARTNHSVVTYNDKMYLFGGTNGLKWFNDVWCYDPATNLWAQLDCIGYIPLAREGHAATLVDDVMYIFGGRTEEGSDLGDLAAFRITSRRWYTFQNMGPSPSPRSGHSMTTVGKSVAVVGGEPSTAATSVSDLGLVYCLDTTKIRYPSDAQVSSRGNPAARRPSTSEAATQNVSAARSLPSRDGSSGPPDARRLAGGGVNSPGGMRLANGVDVNGVNGSSSAAANMAGPGPVHGPGHGNGPGSGSRLPRVAAGLPPTGPAGPPPQGQPPRPGATRSRNASVERADYRQGSPVTTSQSQSPVVQQAPAPRETDSPVTNGRRTPTAQSRSAPRQAEAAAAGAAATVAAAAVAPTPAPAQAPVPVQAQAPAADASRQKPSKPSRVQGSADGAVEPKSSHSTISAMTRPSSPPPPTRQNSNPLSRRSSGRNSQTVVLLKELDSARNRNAWYASELELAKKAGYSPSTSLSPILDGRGAETFDDDDKPLIEALLAMRTELASVQGSIDKQAVLAARQIAEAEKQRDAAVQEAVYAKAKLAAQGGGSGSAAGTPQLGGDKDGDDRAAEISRKLAAALGTQKELQNQVERASAEADAEKRARRLADETASASQKRMADLEAYKQQTSVEVERLKAELHAAQREARERAVEAAEAVSAAQMLGVDKDELQSKYDEMLGSSRESGATLSSLREAVAASAEMKAHLEQKLEEERSLREEAQSMHARLSAEHESRAAELATVTRRLRDAEQLAEKHANEARLHRQAVLSGLDGKLSAEDVGDSKKRGRPDSDRIAALQGQLNAANVLVKKYQQEADSASDRLRSAEERIAGLEAYQEQASREGVSIRRQLQAALRDTQSLQAANADLKHQLAGQQLETNAVTVQHNTLKDLLAERGISPTAGNAATSRARGVGSPGGGSSGSPGELMRLRELEQQLSAALSSHEETKVSAALQAQESESAYREKLAQLENDYQSAVHYVKGTEKMLKQLKEQLSRYKADNSKLKEQVVELEDRAGGVNASATSADWEAQKESLRAEIGELQSELQSTTDRLEGELRSVRQELADEHRKREAAAQHAQEASRQLGGSQKEREQLQQENALLERRVQDAEQKVSLLLDQVETSVGSYRRRSRQVVSMGSDMVAAANAGPPGGTNGMSHARHGSSSETESLYGGGGGGGGSSGLGDARNSTALDNLADELETLRSHWETTSKNYRMSNTFEFDTGATSGRRDDRESLGLSESLNDWRKRLNDERPPGSQER